MILLHINCQAERSTYLRLIQRSLTRKFDVAQFSKAAVSCRRAYSIEGIRSQSKVIYMRLIKVFLVYVLWGTFPSDLYFD